MSAAPWMPLYIADYLRDTSHLGAAESGAYLHLIMHYWTHGSLPNDDKQLVRIARMTEKEWKAARGTLASFFQSGWTHKRIDAELAKSADKTNRRKEAGQRGGLAKAANASSNASHLLGDLPKQNASKTLASSSHSHSSSLRSEEASALEADFRQQIAKCFASVNRLPPDTGRAVVWLANGWKPEICIAVTRDVLSRKANASLAYIEPAIRQAHETPASATGPPRKAAQKSYLTLAAEANGNLHERDYDSSIIDASPVAAEGGGWPDANAGGFGTGRTDSDHPGFAGPIARTAGVFR